MRITPIVLAAAGFAALAACEAEQTQEGELPEVNVTGGQLPEYDVDAANVTVGTTEETVAVPDVDVSTEQENVQVPTVGVQE